jgi:rhodanese-related sulfurtransferase
MNSKLVIWMARCILAKVSWNATLRSINFAEDARLVLYCGGGFRSAIAARSLKDMGYSQAFSLWGGWRAILAEGLDSKPRIAPRQFMQYAF